ncbi:hypothetical protein V8C37DRAFT_203240 [Trichoderma ceciliae]
MPGAAFVSLFSLFFLFLSTCPGHPPSCGACLLSPLHRDACFRTIVTLFSLLNRINESFIWLSADVHLPWLLSPVSSITYQKNNTSSPRFPPSAGPREAH